MHGYVPRRLLFNLWISSMWTLDPEGPIAVDSGCVCWKDSECTTELDWTIHFKVIRFVSQWHEHIIKQKVGICKSVLFSVIHTL